MLMNFTASEMPIARLAEWFEMLFPGQILVPASKLGGTYTTDGPIRDVKLGDLIEKIGFVPIKKPLAGRELATLKRGEPQGCC
jgi:hypothetical protein